MSGASGGVAGEIREKILEVSLNNGFSVKNILVEGRNYTDPASLKAIIGVEKGDPLFAFKPSAAKEEIEKLSWVKKVRIGRRLPDTIYVHLTEREPFALWQHNKKIVLIDREGAVLTSEHLERFHDLIVVVGEDAPYRAEEMLAYLKAEPSLYGRTEAARLIGNRRWDLILKGGVEAKLPEQDIGLALRSLAKAQEEDGILDRGIMGVDLREAGRISIQTRPGAVQNYQAGMRAEGDI